jgi:hypothetical protein
VCPRGGLRGFQMERAIGTFWGTFDFVWDRIQKKNDNHCKKSIVDWIWEISYISLLNFIFIMSLDKRIFINIHNILKCFNIFQSIGYE